MVQTGSLNEVDLRGEGIVDAPIQDIKLWGNALLLTTGETIVVWRQGLHAQSWTTRTYASRSGIPLYLLSFLGDSALSQDTVRFQLLPPNHPSAVKFQIGDWMEIVATEGIEGIVDDADWRAYQKRWVDRFWDCGDSLCFARVRIPHQGSFIQGDFIDVPFTYIGKDPSGIKIGFRAAWARKEDLLPVLMPR